MKLDEVRDKISWRIRDIQEEYQDPTFDKNELFALDGEKDGLTWVLDMLYNLEEEKDECVWNF